MAPKKSAAARKPAPRKGGGSRVVLAVAVLVAAAVIALVWFGRDLASRVAPRRAPVAAEKRAAPARPTRGTPRAEPPAGTEPPAPPPAENTIDAAVRAYAAQGGATVRAGDYQVAPVELAAGKEQALVLLHAASFCGSCGCTLLVLQRGADAWSLVSDVSCVSPSIRVGDAKSHGWRDLVIDSGDTYVLHFDGRSYPPSPQDGERVPNAPGTPVAMH